MTKPTPPPPPPRDWDKELADIDRLMGKQPVAPPPARRPAESSSVPAGRPPVPSGRSRLGAWLRVLLGVAIGVGMAQWPYAHGCGLMLYLYFGAGGVVVLAGIWGMHTSWKRRMALAHVLSLAVALWGVFLSGKVILDRTGYVKAPKSWFCSASPSPNAR